MKKKKIASPPITSKLLSNNPSPKDFLTDIENLTVEDVVVMYAYAEAIVETVREPLIILDENLRIKTANKSFFDTFKVTKQETYHKKIFNIGNGQWDIPELKKLLIDILPKNSHFDNFEITHKFETIGIRTMMLNARRIILEGHKTELILLAIEDITKRKKIDKQKDDFIGITSHELRTPLTSIKTFIHILKSHNKKANDMKNLFILDKVSTQIDRMEHMMSSFINVYMLQTGKLELHKEYFIFDDLMRDILETFDYTQDSHVIKRIGKSVKQIYADKERVGQVLTNLIANAIKYSPNANKIIIETKDDNKNITVSVQDFGIGIPKKQHKQIFDRFFRAKGIEENNIPGLGLGLYIAFGIINEHKGKMWVESKLGKGSTFYFTLPLNKK